MQGARVRQPARAHIKHPRMLHVLRCVQGGTAARYRWHAPRAPKSLGVDPESPICCRSSHHRGDQVLAAAASRESERKRRREREEMEKGERQTKRVCASQAP